jgi:hypothetical protein
MDFLTSRPVSRRIVGAVVLGLYLLAATGPTPVQSAESTNPEEEYATRIQTVYASRSEGKYDRALSEIEKMIADFAQADTILRELHNEMVKTIHQQRNATQDPAERARLENRREEQARETLRLYPDITAGVGYASVDELYDVLRAEMFGELNIITSPDSCEVLIDGVYYGPSPFYKQYFPVGTHTVRVIKAQHEEKEITVQVEPAGTLTREVSLTKIRGYMWWLTRVAAPVIAGVGIVIGVATAGGDGQTEDQPLPEPPPPPTY